MPAAKYDVLTGFEVQEDPDTPGKRYEIGDSVTESVFPTKAALDRAISDGVIAKHETGRK